MHLVPHDFKERSFILSNQRRGSTVDFSIPIKVGIHELVSVHLIEKSGSQKRILYSVVLLSIMITFAFNKAYTINFSEKLDLQL